MISIDGIFGLALAPLFTVLILAFFAALFFQVFHLALAKVKASRHALHVAELNATYEGNRRSLIDRRHFADRRVSQVDRRHPIAA